LIDDRRVKNVAIATVLGASFLFGCLILRGIYEIHPSNGIAWRVNRPTGSVEICSLSTDTDFTVAKGCQPLPQLTKEEADQAVAEAYLAAHPDRAKAYGLEVAPSSSPSPQAYPSEK
jgi:hypothetical protein